MVFVLSDINKGLFGFRMRNKILRRSEKIETRSEKHDFSDRNLPVYVIQWRITCSLSNTSSRSVLFRYHAKAVIRGK